MRINYLIDEKLKFGNRVEAFDPRIGLLNGGPFGPSDPNTEVEFRIINCGIIGTPRSIADMKHFIRKISFSLGANNKTYGNYGFPGLGINSPLRFSLRCLPQWEATILDRDIQRIADLNQKNDQKNQFLTLVENKIIQIKRDATPPQIIFMVLNPDMINIFKRQGIASDDIVFANRNFPDTVYESEGDINFHSILKIFGMHHGFPTQIVKSSTLEFDGTEDQVTTAWNFVVAQLYKSNAIPWKFSELENDVCYVGLDFFRDFSHPDVSMNTSMAQVFLHTGESFILEGDSFEWQRTEEEKSPHLTFVQSQSIIDKVLDQYYSIKNHYPARIVIHKSSDFTLDEKNGLYANQAEIDNIDMVTIDFHPKLRFFRQMKYPVMRGTLISMDDNSEHFLFTYGFIPTLKTYPGMRAPIPLGIKLFTPNSDIEKICKEILILTRLDWNNIKYCQREPVTLKFSDLVGDILAERRASQIDIQYQYRYYM